MPPKRRPSSYQGTRGRKPPATRSSGAHASRIKRKGPPKGPRPALKPSETGPESRGERLQKALAQAGVGSRRACEGLILQGRVTIDGEVVRELGTRVDPKLQKVAVDGQVVRIERPVYFAVYKPRGHVSTNSDPAGRPRVIDLLPEVPQRVYAIGRLDEDSAGLMLLTNDGDLANRLAHPKFGVEKVYRALVAGEPGEDLLKKLTEGVWLSDGKARAKRAWIVGRQGQATTIELVLAEGKNREVRRMLAKLGHKVMTLTRVAVGPITLKGLKSGGWRTLSRIEVDLLRRVAAGESVRPFGPPRQLRPISPPRRGAARVQGAARPTGTATGAPPPPTSQPATGGPPSRPMGPRSAGPQSQRPMGPASMRGEDARPTGPRAGGARPQSRQASSGPAAPPSMGGPKRPPARPSRPAPPQGGRPTSVPDRTARPSAPPAPSGRTVIGLDLGPDGPGRAPRRPAPRKRPMVKPRRRPRTEGDEGA
jgi:23S rRNA pseudouridine2605 synthase